MAQGMGKEHIQTVVLIFIQHVFVWQEGKLRRAQWCARGEAGIDL